DLPPCFLNDWQTRVRPREVLAGQFKRGVVGGNHDLSDAVRAHAFGGLGKFIDRRLEKLRERVAIQLWVEMARRGEPGVEFGATGTQDGGKGGADHRCQGSENRSE